MDDCASRESRDRLSKCAGRWAVLAFGWLCVGLGFVGAVVPGMPTTVFLLIALWAFSKSSRRFQVWLWEHPRFGPSLQAWHRHRVIPFKAKVLAVSSMSLSFLYLTLFVAEGWLLPAVLAVVMLPVAAYLISRAGSVPEGAEAS